MHPPYDCEDCGRLHMAWSVVERDRLARETELAEHGDVAELRLTRLHSITPDGTPLYVEVADPDYVPSTDTSAEPF
jgi:hypothetical protein